MTRTIWGLMLPPISQSACGFFRMENYSNYPDISTSIELQTQPGNKSNTVERNFHTLDNGKMANGKSSKCASRASADLSFFKQISTKIEESDAYQSIKRNHKHLKSSYTAVLQIVFVEHCKHMHPPVTDDRAKKFIH